MRQETINRLLKLNHEFYTTFSTSFSKTRSQGSRDLDKITRYITSGARVLDIGCGNGRVAHRLIQQGIVAHYVGIDRSMQLIEIAQSAFQDDTIHCLAPQPRFLVIDITSPHWPDFDKNHLQFDTVLLLAVLHHIPSSALRQRLLSEVAGLLTPAGRLILSTWQFLDHPRMRKKIVGWENTEIDIHDLEPGDYLLDWKHDGFGIRYCHLIDQKEIHALAADTGFSILETFRAGGHEGNLSLYAILTKA